MAKRITNGEIREQLAILRTENQTQTKSIDKLVQVMENHEQESTVYRQQTRDNVTNIRWHRRWLVILSLGLLIVLSIITGINFLP